MSQRVPSARELFWTVERIEELRDLAALKLTAGDIAERMDPSLTKNSIIGKCHREGIRLWFRRLKPAAKVKAIKRSHGGGRPRKVVTPAEIEIELEREPLPPPPEPTYTAVHFIHARHDQCQFPLWDHTAKIGNVCGAKRLEGKPYCGPCHMRVNTGLIYRRPMRMPYIGSA